MPAYQQVLVSARYTLIAPITDLHFVGCGSTIVMKVEKLLAENIIFQGESGGAAVMLLDIRSARILLNSLVYNFGNNSNLTVRSKIRVQAITIKIMFFSCLLVGQYSQPSAMSRLKLPHLFNEL